MSTTPRWIMYISVQTKWVSPYLLSRGRLYSSHTQTFVWRGENASPQLSALCLEILGARAPFFWFWLPDKSIEHIGPHHLLDVFAQMLRRRPRRCYLRCCCYLCLSSGTSLLCCDHGCGCRGQFWDGWLLHFLVDYLQVQKQAGFFSFTFFLFFFYTCQKETTVYLWWACFAQLCCTASVPPSPSESAASWGAVVSNRASPEALL